MGYINQMPILELRSKFGLDLAIETGTQHAQGTLELLKYFHWVYTIEIDTKLWSNAYSLLQEYSGARCLLGNSPDVLEMLLMKPEKPNNILFWLDAHFPGDRFNKTDLDWNGKIVLPLFEELKTIWRYRESLWKTGQAKDVIIIDDARIYEEADFELGNWEHCLKDNSYLEPFGFYRTHDIKLDLRQTGYRILTPRQ